MTEFAHQPCPYESCGSSDAFSWNDEGYGNCFSCGNAYPKKGAKVFDWAADRYPVASYKPAASVEPSGVSYEDIRGIEPDVCKLFGIQRQVDANGNWLRDAFKYPNNTKYRTPDKKFFFKNRGVSPLDLFGPEFNAGSSKRIYLTEGEYDAASLYQILGKSFPVKSLPSASIGDKFIKHNHPYLDSFEQIVYAGEQSDAAGSAAADRLYQAYPQKFYYVPMSKWKDANEFLTEGDGDELKWAALKPQRYSPDNFFCSTNEFLKILHEENPYEATPTGHTGIDYMTRGLVRGGVTFIKAPPGSGKCLAPHVPVLTYSGIVKKAIDVKVGDKLMGPDGTPRKVLAVNVERGQMYRITPTKGESWECNLDHILSLKKTGTEEIKNVTLEEWLTWSNYEKSRWKLWRTGVESFGMFSSDYGKELAYCVGAYVGDGRKDFPEICVGKKKQAVLDYMVATYLEPTRIKYEKNAYYVGFSRLSALGKACMDAVNDQRHVPPRIKYSSYDDRRYFLAGLLDTDGYLLSGSIDLVQKSERLADDVCFVARSLGLAAYKSVKKVRLKDWSEDRDYFRVSISGHLSILPCLRLQVQTRKQVKDVLKTGFTVEHIGEGDYRGIVLDGDHLFLLGDFTVTHNTEVVRWFERAMLDTEDTKIALIHMEEMKSTTLRCMATYELGVNVRTEFDQSESGISDEQLDEAVVNATKDDRTIIFEMRSHDDPIKIIEYCRLACGVYGADYVFIDHVQRLTYLGGTDGATNTLTQIASNLAQLGKELNVGIIVISHVNEDGHTKYAKSLEEEAIICLRIERDKESEDEYTQNLTKFYIEKNRPFSRLGPAGMVYYDPDTTLLSEVNFDV